VKISEVLDGAADVVERNGWIKGQWYDEPEMPRSPLLCKVCALGAINVAGGQRPDKPLDGEQRGAALALARHLGFTDATIDDFGVVRLVGETWNDTIARSDDEVIAELRATAAAEREAGR